MLTSFAMTLALSANAPTLALAYSIYPVLAEFFVTFTGYAIQVNHVPVYWRWATNVSYTRWMFEGLMINHWNRYETDDYTGDAKDGNGDILDLYDFKDFNKFNCVAIIAVFLAASLAITYCGLLAPTSHLEKVSLSIDNKVCSPSSSVTSTGAVTLQQNKQGSKTSATTGLKRASYCRRRSWPPSRMTATTTVPWARIRRSHHPRSSSRWSPSAPARG